MNLIRLSNVSATPEIAPQMVEKMAWTVLRMAWRIDWKKANTDCRAAPTSWKREEIKDIIELTNYRSGIRVCAYALLWKYSPRVFEKLGSGSDSRLDDCDCGINLYDTQLIEMK